MATPAKAIELLQIAVPMSSASRAAAYMVSSGPLYPACVRGKAYLAAHQGAKAATEFQKILDHRGIVVSDPIGALARLQLDNTLCRETRPKQRPPIRISSPFGRTLTPTSRF